MDLESWPSAVLRFLRSNVYRCIYFSFSWCIIEQLCEVVNKFYKVRISDDCIFL